MAFRVVTTLTGRKSMKIDPLSPDASRKALGRIQHIVRYHGTGRAVARG
jgi:hypothetical protein